ncbi:MAG: hypothetical protein A2048_10670 [Deltaproteobacteria bacterium GWA2_45_12]|nr:MAG: hypothetical protein A2048_10670 [Deltaproteobacteria bacterium GWA2_45_12]
MRISPFPTPHFQKELIIAIVEIKNAAALTHLEVGELDKARSGAIVFLSWLVFVSFFKPKAQEVFHEV